MINRSHGLTIAMITVFCIVLTTFQAFAYQDISGFSEEEKENLGVGFVFGWPHYGISFKKWVSEKLGIEGIAFPTTSQTSSTLHLSGRILYKLDTNRKNMFPYIAFGIGQFSSSSGNVSRDPITLGSLFFGIEFSSFYTLEFGFGVSSSNNSNSYGTVSLENGFHYYF